jgi:hypothetical protein
MNFRDMIDEVVAFRFNSAQTDYVKRWLNMREQEVWMKAEWPFKKMVGVTLTIDEGDKYLDLPGAVRRVHNIYDETGVPLSWYPPEDFAARNRTIGDSGHPAEYTLSGNQLVISPKADHSYEFTVDYERAVCHYNSSGTVITGPMSIDTDYPLWDPAYYWILVAGATATGLKMENDPTYQPLENEFLHGIEMMIDDLLPPSHASTLQYGRDNLG